jgi:hypothetical protein
MGIVKAVDQAGFDAKAAKLAADNKQSDRLDPQVIGCDVMNPGVDKQNTGGHGLGFRVHSTCLQFFVFVRV